MRDATGQGAQPQAVQLLQTRGSARRSLGRPSRELERVLPIAWVHFPKCGTSFLNTIAHSPGVCPSLPEDARIERNVSLFRTESHVNARNCPGLSSFNFNHPALGSKTQPPYEEGKGHYMAMLREPDQRILSAYSDMRECSRDPECNVTILGSWGGWHSEELPDLAAFARRQAGCMVRMLTRTGFPCGGLLEIPVSPYEVAEARRRLREGFAFVGINEYWDLSICLYSAMFKVGCSRMQFQDVRPGPDKWDNASRVEDLDADDERRVSSEARDVSALNGFTDVVDGELYAEALDIFEGNLKRYHVSEAACEPCWRDAGLLPGTPSVQKLVELGRSA